jgi:protein-glutamine gamma-glutamyltransferase
MSAGSVKPSDARPLFLFPALALWGWQADLLPWALVMGFLLELPRWIRTRLDIRAEDFGRLWNFTALLFFGVGLYLFLARESTGGGDSAVGGSSSTNAIEGIREMSQIFLQFLRALPFIFFPFILAHAWSQAGALPWTAFSLYTRARAAAQALEPESDMASVKVHPTPGYLAVALFASCASVNHPILFLPLLLIVLMGALWPWRNPGTGWPLRALLLTILAALTAALPLALNQVRQAWQNLEGRLLQGAGAGGFDPLRTVTSLGAIGRLQLSGTIILRIRSPDLQSPGLLREGVYNRYRSQTWSTSHREFSAVGSSLDTTVWKVAAGRPTGLPLTIARAAGPGETPLALPGTVVTVRDLLISAIETNYLGSARLREQQPLAIYSVERGSDGGFNGPPETSDTDLEPLGEIDREVIQSVATSLRLETLSPPVAVRTLERFFSTGFEYSLWQGKPSAATNSSPLSIFLRETRAGHCEYFATATVLLLRAAGVPARYAVGYSPEARRDGDWVARGRDAHAWCLAYVEGRWRVVDTTPGIWREREAARSPVWEGVRDLFSDAWFQFGVWRQQGGNWQVAVFAAGMLILSWMGWRQLRGSRWRRTPDSNRSRQSQKRPPGWDSEFYPVLTRLENRRGPRAPSETLLAWLRRTQPVAPPPVDPFSEALDLHQRLRFDPRGLSAPERDRLRRLANDLTLNGSG